LSQSVDIGQLGEEAVVTDLESKAYIGIKRNTRGPGSTDIEATNTHGRKQLFQVKTAVLPSVPDDLSSSEITAIISRAARIGASAYQAKVQLNSNLTVIAPIHYAKLTK